jgi:hypothetical protein
MHKLTNTLSPSPKGFQRPKFLDSDFSEVRGLGLGRPKSSAIDPFHHEEARPRILLRGADYYFGTKNVPGPGTNNF